MKTYSLEKLEFPQIKAHLVAEARTEQGKFRLKELVPETDFSLLEEEAAKVYEMTRVLAQAGRPPIPELAALGPVLKRAEKGGVLGVAEVLLVRRYLITARELKAFLRPLKDLVRLKALVSSLPSLTELFRTFEHYLDDRGLRPEASDLLVSLRQKRKRLEERLRQRLEDLLKQYARAGLLQEEIITKRRERYVFPVKAEARGKVPGILHDVSASGATVFIEPLEIVTIENELEALRQAERREIERLLKELSEEIARFVPELYLLEEILAELDVLQAKASFGAKLGGSLSKLKPAGEIKLKEAAHPLLLLSGRAVVRNDFLFPAEKPVAILSGPNMGGKTVALKTLGLLLVMAQCALPIPAAPESELPVFKEIFVDLGDEQDLVAHESTFSAHVKRLKEAIELAGPGVLFLLDEIGRGTAPEEGAALAMAVIEELYEKGARVLATTHYEALKVFSLTRDWVLPLAVSFDEETGRPNYKLLYGLSGLSLGLRLAENLGLPAHLVARAKRYLGRGEEHFAEVLAALKRELEALKQEREALAREREELSARKELYLREKQALKEEFSARKRALEREFEKRLALLEKRFEEFLRTLEEKRLKEKKARLAFGSFLKERVKEFSPSPAQEEGPLRPGARVKLKGLGQEGRILRLKGQVAEVQLGPFRVEVDAKDLIVLPEEGPRPPRSEGFKVVAEKEAPEAVNLIGYTVEEALRELDKVLDRAFLAGKARLTIIHGLGTGRLLKAIREYLKGHVQVASLRPGSPLEGGEAVTVVELAAKGGRGGA